MPRAIALELDLRADVARAAEVRRAAPSIARESGSISSSAAGWPGDHLDRARSRAPTGGPNTCREGARVSRRWSAPARPPPTSWPSRRRSSAASLTAAPHPDATSRRSGRRRSSRCAACPGRGAAVANGSAGAAPRTRRRSRSRRARRAAARSRRPCGSARRRSTRKRSPMSGPCEIRPRAGLSPTRPQQAAGCGSSRRRRCRARSGRIPAATAAAAPPDEPPGVRSRSHGLRVGPNAAARSSAGSRTRAVVVPTITKPASRSRRTT